MAPRDGDKPATGILRQSLAASSQVEGGCPDPEILAAHFERSLDADEIARWELHFSECASCREQLAAMVRAGETVAVTGGERESGSAWSWLWDWRLMVPAFAVLILAAGIWYAGRGTQPRLVAMSTPSESPVAPPAPQSSSETNAPASTARPAPAASMAEAKAEREGELQRGQSRAMQKSESGLDKTTAANQLSSERDRGVGVAASKDEKPAEPAAADRVKDSSAVASSVTTPDSELPAAPAPQVPAVGGQLAPPEPHNAMAGGALSGAAGFGASRATTRKKEMLAAPTTAGPLLQDKASAGPQTAEKSSSQVVIRTPDPKIMWRIAEAGFVELTIDGGATWEGQLPSPDAQLVAGSAPAAKVCWLVGSGGIILLTRDGTNWKTIQPPAPIDFIAITAKDASSATVAGSDGREFTTADGGNHWNAVH